MSRGHRRRRREAPLALPSAGQTVVSLELRRLDDGGPWPLTRVLTALGAFDVQRVGVARALGDRHGVPLVHSQDLHWHDHDVFLEARHEPRGADQLIVELPPWDELEAEVADNEIWHFIDTVAAGADAQFGSIGDGEPAETALPDDSAMLRAQLRRHLALLLPTWSEDDVAGAGASADRLLEASGLLVVTG